MTKVAEVATKAMWQSQQYQFAVVAVGKGEFEKVYVHPRYLPKGVKKDIIIRNGRLKGRTTYFDLHKVVEFEGVKYTKMNIKGAGAAWKIDHEIDPNFQPQGPQMRTRRRFNSSRIWGGLMMPDAQEEMEIYSQIKKILKFSPIVAINRVPPQIEREIKTDKKFQDFELAQLVRLSDTELRISDLWANEAPDCPIEPEIIADCAIQLIRLQIELKKQKKGFDFEGDIKDNTYVDGTFTDAENFVIRRMSREESIRIVARLIMDLSDPFPRINESNRYFGRIDKTLNTKLAEIVESWEDEEREMERLGLQLDHAI
jgi:hypothetical protein